MSDSPRNFLALGPDCSDAATARYAVLPVPFEGTVSYKPGTAAGPFEILDASAQVELFDEELGGEFHTAGIATYPIVQPAPGVEEQLRRVKDSALGILRSGKFPLALGGEHSITVALVRAAAEVCGEISVLQIDAHADLRDSYEGTRYSHACVMRRVLEITDRVCQVGVRSFSRQEQEECPRQIAELIAPADIDSEGRWLTKALKLLGKKVYITIDMDGFDPSIAPGVGTPEPGGLRWRQVLRLLRLVCRRREVVGADIVETRPIPPNHVTEFLAARLAYKIIAYTQSE